ncbi:MAG: hypothetical protein J5879_06400 [Clostridia bacterium]|nr:hypothetical protein [Clostridia bacterium]
MKNLIRIITVTVVSALLIAVLPAATHALDANDWAIVTYDGTVKDHARISVSENKGIRMESEGHYPASYAGLTYTKPLSVKDGISVDITMEELNGESGDVWFSMVVLSAPVCFDYSAKNEGKGIWILQRPGTVDTNVIADGSLKSKGSFKPGDFAPDKNYYEPGATIHYDIKIEDGALVVYIDGVKVEADFSDALEYFEDGQCYFGFSTSDTTLSHQSFVVDYVNGEQAASEGHLEGGENPVETEEPIDFENVDSFVLADFTDPDILSRIGGIQDCKISFDEDEGCIKVTVTGEDPHFEIPMSKSRYFDGDKFTVLRVSYKTDEDHDGTIYFTTKNVPKIDYCYVEWEFEKTDGFKDALIDMDESSNWMDEVRSLRFDPADDGKEGQVFYFKSVSVEVFTEPETEKKPDTEPVQTKADDTDTNADTTAAPVTGGETTADAGKPSGKPGSGRIWFVVGGCAAAAAVIAAVVVIIKKKKK